MNGIQKQRENMNPANYTSIGWYYVGSNPLEFTSDFGFEWLKKNNLPTDSYVPCSHCGTNHAWGVIYKDQDGNEFNVGCQCANEFFNYGNKYDYQMKELRKKIAAEKEKAEIKAIVDDFATRYPDTWKKLQGNHPIIKDIKHRFEFTGRISDKQVELVNKLHEKELEKENKRQNGELVPVKEGRHNIKGVILSTKVSDSYYGIQIKMLVDCGGYKVYGSVPSSLDIPYTDLPSMEVEFTATVEKSDRDESFGFFKRPSKASFTNESQFGIDEYGYKYRKYENV